MDRLALDFLRLITRSLWGTMSIVEFVVVLEAVAAAAGVVANFVDVHAEMQRAVETNGAKLTMMKGAWRRAVADGIKVSCFVLIGFAAALAPPAPVDTEDPSGTVLVTLLLLTILTCISFNQVNDFFTRQVAVRQYNELYSRLERAGTRGKKRYGIRHTVAEQPADQPPGGPC